MNILITICGRGGSRGIPGKNLRLLAGKPLIAYSIETARLFSFGRQTVIALSTDSEEIVSVANDFGLHTSYRRPAELATDDAGKLATIKHLLRFEEERNGNVFDLIVDLDITSPLRTPEDLNKSLAMLEADKDALNIFSVSPAARNPYFNMVEQNERGYFQLCKKGSFVTRQSAPRVFDMNASFYMYRRLFFENGFGTVITERTLAYEVPHLCFDLDHPIDFEFMEYLLSNKRLDFSL